MIRVQEEDFSLEDYVDANMDFILNGIKN